MRHVWEIKFKSSRSVHGRDTAVLYKGTLLEQRGENMSQTQSHGLFMELQMLSFTDLTKNSTEAAGHSSCLELMPVLLQPSGRSSPPSKSSESVQGRENECQGLQIPEVDAEIAKLISMFSSLKSSKKKATSAERSELDPTTVLPPPVLFCRRHTAIAKKCL
jgi:hypothetical protein